LSFYPTPLITQTMIHYSGPNSAGHKVSSPVDVRLTWREPGLIFPPRSRDRSGSTRFRPRRTHWRCSFGWPDHRRRL